MPEGRLKIIFEVCIELVRSFNLLYIFNKFYKLDLTKNMKKLKTLHRISFYVQFLMSTMMGLGFPELQLWKAQYRICTKHCGHIE